MSAPSRKERNTQLFLDKDYDTLYEENINLIRHICGKFDNLPYSFEELLDLGNVAYCKAINTFDPTKSNFATYLSRIACNEILYFHRRNRKHHENTISIEEAVHTDQQGNMLTLEDVLTTGETPETELLKEVELEILDECIDSLGERDRTILRAFMENKNQKDIAQELGISQSYISRIQKRIIEKMRILLKRKEGKIMEQQPVYKKPVKRVTNEESVNQQQENEVSKLDSCYKLFDKGLNVKEVYSQLSPEVPLSTIKVYHTKWKKYKQLEQPSESTTSLVSGEEPAEYTGELEKVSSGESTKPLLRPCVWEGQTHTYQVISEEGKPSHLSIGVDQGGYIEVPIPGLSVFIQELIELQKCIGGN